MMTMWSWRSTEDHGLHCSPNRAKIAYWIGHLLNTVAKVRAARLRSKPDVAPEDVRLMDTNKTDVRFIVPALLLSLLVACGQRVSPAADEFGAFNESGGAHRSNDFSVTESAPVTELQPEPLTDLIGGIRAGPLTLDDGSTVVMCGGDNGRLPSVARLFHTATQWTVSLPPGHFPLPGLAADSGHHVYVAASSGTLWAISPVGQLLWNRRFSDPNDPTAYTPSPPLALANGAVVGDSRGRLVRYDRRGTMVWHVQRGAAVTDRPCGDPDIGVVVALTRNDYALNDTIVALDPATGAERWVRTVPGRILTAPIVRTSGVVVCTGALDSSGRRLPRIRAYSTRGEPEWSAPLPLMPRGIACTDDGAIYVSCAGASRDQNGGAVIAFDSTGGRTWIVKLGTGVAAPVAITSDWICFVGRRHGETGVYTYSRQGTFAAFVPVDLLPDVSSRVGITPNGSIVLSGLDDPVLLIGN